MGWLNIGARTVSPHQEISKYTAEHIEVTPSDEETPHLQEYPFVAFSVPDHDLPFISPTEVSSRKSARTGGLFIVINNLVYDCTSFIHSHPGGTQVIESFAGAECSWQFWRFHGKKEMDEFGRGLRVARTRGLENKFMESARFVGLRRLGDEWD